METFFSVDVMARFNHLFGVCWIALSLLEADTCLLDDDEIADSAESLLFVRCQ